MTILQPESKKHHFVPRSLLKYFRDADTDDFIFVYNKQDGRAFRTSLMNAGSENGFNTFEDGPQKVNFEDDFLTVDGLLATRLREIHEARSFATLTKQHRKDWAELVAVQLLRTPIIRSTMSVSIDALNREVVENFGVGLDLAALSEDDVRKVARGLFQDRREAIDALVTKDFVLFEAIGDIPFRISDRPVTIETSLPFGDTGLTSLGVAMFMPLGRNLLLGLYCPSIAKKLNEVELEKLNLPEDVRTRLAALKVGLQTGSIVRLDESMVKKHNAQQIGGGMRFVYGPSKDFEDARALINENPQIRTVLSTINVGKMGKGPGPRSQMPLGAWLVLIGQDDSHMLEVIEVSDAGPFEATVLDAFALEQALKHGHFSEMQYYIDRQCRRGMRKVQLARVENDMASRVQVRHSDPSLEALMRMLDK